MTVFNRSFDQNSSDTEETMVNFQSDMVKLQNSVILTLYFADTSAISEQNKLKFHNELSFNNIFQK